MDRKEYQKRIYDILKSRNLLYKDYKYVNSCTLSSYFVPLKKYELNVSIVNYNNKNRPNSIIIRDYCSGEKLLKYQLDELYVYLKR